LLFNFLRHCPASPKKAEFPLFYRLFQGLFTDLPFFLHQVISVTRIISREHFIMEKYVVVPDETFVTGQLKTSRSNLKKNEGQIGV
jgi:hypothetical protein